MVFRYIIIVEHAVQEIIQLSETRIVRTLMSISRHLVTEKIKKQRVKCFGSESFETNLTFEAYVRRELMNNQHL